jgi:hypothetical protein
MAEHRTGAAWQLGVIFFVVLLLWSTVLVYPLKVLVVLLHEISHGLAAVATGGRIDHIEVNANQGGVCYTYGGNRFLTLSAGYLGSMGFGAAILLLASRSRRDREICMAFGAFILLMTLLFVRNWFGFGLGLAAGGALVLGAWNLPHAFSDTILKTIGLTSCLYAILDIKSDVIDRRGIGSDADMLASHTGLPSIIWGAIWIVAAIAVAAVTLRAAARGEVPAARGAGSLSLLGGGDR